MRVDDYELGAEMPKPDAEKLGEFFVRIVLGGEGRQPYDELVGYIGYGLRQEGARLLFQPTLEALVHLGVILEKGRVDALELDQPNLDELRGLSIGHVGRSPFRYEIEMSDPLARTSIDARANFLILYRHLASMAKVFFALSENSLDVSSFSRFDDRLRARSRSEKPPRGES